MGSKLDYRRLGEMAAKSRRHAQFKMPKEDVTPGAVPDLVKSRIKEPVPRFNGKFIRKATS